MSAMHPQVLILGVGNEYRHDDGVGIAVARRLQGRMPAGVSIREESGDGAALLEAWAQQPAVVLVDAVDCGAPPGTCFKLAAHAEPLPSRLFRGSTHAFGVVEAVELARALNQLPRRLLVYGIQGRDFRAGLGLSAEVEAGVPVVMEEIMSELLPFKTGAQAAWRTMSWLP